MSIDGLSVLVALVLLEAINLTVAWFRGDFEEGKFAEVRSYRRLSMRGENRHCM